MEHAVVVVGAGPAGMMLAAELALADVDVALVERRPAHVLAGSRAGGFHARTIELFDQRGIADRFLAEGRPVQAIMFGTARLDMSDFPSRHPYTLGIFQNKIERIMAGWIAELGVEVLYGREVAAVSQHASGVDVAIADGTTVQARYLVGCDGGRSIIRRAAGIGFPGWPATRSTLIAELEVREEPPEGINYDAAGAHAFGRLEDSTMFRVVTGERELGPSTPPTLADLSAALIDAYGSDFGVHSPTWISRFTDATRQADAYRVGRILLAGDAAHIHYPAGGQGIGFGIQDAVNLGWKLAQVVKGVAGEDLLDSYQDERHPAVARGLRLTIALAELQRADARMKALVAEVSELAQLDEARTHLAGLISGLDIHYDLGAGHPLLGRRMPDLDLRTADGEVRLFLLLDRARPLAIDFTAGGRMEIAGWTDRVARIDASYDGAWELPVIGTVAAPSGVLVRPDGYVAWVGEDDCDGDREPERDGDREPERERHRQAGLEEALTRWFGAPATTWFRSSGAPAAT